MTHILNEQQRKISARHREFDPTRKAGGNKSRFPLVMSPQRVFPPRYARWLEREEGRLASALLDRRI